MTTATTGLKLSLGLKTIVAQHNSNQEIGKEKMKVLVSAGMTLQSHDFCFVPEGELLRLGIIVCCNSYTCGCNRSFSGTENPKATTLGRVAELDITKDDLFDLAAKLGRRDGWGGDLILASLRALITGIEDLPVGTLVRPHYTDSTDWVFNVVEESKAVL